MGNHLPNKPQSQLKSVKNLCVDDPRPLLEQVFSAAWIDQILKQCEPSQGWRDRVFPPLVTIWVFINQILSKDHSCQMAVATLVAQKSLLKLKRVSSDTGAYCRARMRLPLELIKKMAMGAASRLLDKQLRGKSWKGFEVLVADGSNLSLPDTQANRKIYCPASHGHGLLKMRVLGIFSLHTASLVRFSIGPFRGKGTGEVSMLRDQLKYITKQNLLLMDRLFGSYIDMGLLFNHGTHFVVRSFPNQKPKRVKRLGQKEWLVELERPKRGSISRGSVAGLFLDRLPMKLMLRQVRVVLKNKGFRTKTIYLMTSLLDTRTYPRENISELYKWRWNAETDFRSIKIGLGMDVLRCKTPHMIEKEVWMHVLVYNLIRVVMVESGINQDVSVRTMSFQECVQLFEQFRILCIGVSDEVWAQRYNDLLHSLQSRVGNRPGRREPRLCKHNLAKYNLLRKTRAQARLEYHKKGAAYLKRKKDINLSKRAS